MSRAGVVAGVSLAGIALGGCELSQVTLAESRDVVVAEVMIQVGQTSNRVAGFLHRSRTEGVAGTVPDADVRITTARGDVIQLLQTGVEECLILPERTDPVPGTCYEAGPLESLRLGPGDSLALTVDLADGSRLTGETVIAGDFEIRSPLHPACALPPGETREILWTSSEGAWAYVNETRIEGLRNALAGRGVDVETDPLDLLGVSVSAADTTIVFPSEFGVFERFDLDRELAILLQEGLPAGTSAIVLVAAADRNWVNWVRGGDFNPSGEIRVPSIRGDGTGVFGSVVVRSVRFDAGRDPAALPPC